MANKKRKPTSKRGRTAVPVRRSPAAANKQAARKQSAGAAISESALRTWVANHSRGLIVVLARMPQFFVPTAMVALLAVGLLTPVAIAVTALVVVFLFMGWLAFLSWPVLAPQQRGLRVLAIGLITFAAVGRIAGWF